MDAAAQAAAAHAEADKVVAQIDEQTATRMLAGEAAVTADATAREAHASHEAALQSTAALEERAAAADDAAQAAADLAEGAHELKREAESRAVAAAKAAERAQKRAHFAAEARIDAEHRVEIAAEARLKADARAAEAARSDAFAEQLAEAAARGRDAHAGALVAAENSAAELRESLSRAQSKRERLAELEAEHDRLQELLSRERARAAEAEARAAEARAAESENTAAALHQHGDAEPEATLEAEERTRLAVEARGDEVPPLEQQIDDSPAAAPNLFLRKIGGRRKYSRWLRLKAAFGIAPNPKRPLDKIAPPPGRTQRPSVDAPVRVPPIDAFAVLDPLLDDEPPAPPEAPYVDTDEHLDRDLLPELPPEPAGPAIAEAEPVEPDVLDDEPFPGSAEEPGLGTDQDSNAGAATPTPTGTESAPVVSTPRRTEPSAQPTALPEPHQTDKHATPGSTGTEEPPAARGAERAGCSAPREETGDDPGTGSVPSFVEYRQSEAWRWLIGAAFAVLSVLAVVVVFAAVARPSGRAFAFALVITAAAGLAWWAFLNWSPTIVSISNGILEVTHGDRATSVELCDAADRLELSGDPGSRSWRAVVQRPEGGQLTIRARQVKTAEFQSIVRHHADPGTHRSAPREAHADDLRGEARTD